MRTQAAKLRSFVGTAPSVRSWTQACRAWSTPVGPRTKVTDGAAGGGPFRGGLLSPGGATRIVGPSRPARPVASTCPCAPCPGPALLGHWSAPGGRRGGRATGCCAARDVQVGAAAPQGLCEGDPYPVFTQGDLEGTPLSVPRVGEVQSAPMYWTPTGACPLSVREADGPRQDSGGRSSNLASCGGPLAKPTAGRPSHPRLGSLVRCTAPGLPGGQDQQDGATPADHDRAPAAVAHRPPHSPPLPDLPAL